jgi:predicted DNA-binding transcriptional regulator YafY
MKYTIYTEKLQIIKYLAEHKRVGTPRCLAQKLNVSERTLQRMVQQLRDLGCPILFNRNRNCYEIKTC